MLQLLRRVAVSEFASNVRRLVVGAGLAQLITLLTTLVVARLFNPVDFGLAALFLSVTMMTASIGSLRYDQAILLPESTHIAARLLMLSILLAFATSCVLLAALGIFAWAAPGFAWVSQLGPWLYAVPLGTLLLSVSSAVSAWWMRNRRFGRLAAGPVALSAVSGGGRISFGLWSGSSAAGLILGTLMGMLAQLWVVLWGSAPCCRRAI